MAENNETSSEALKASIQPIDIGELTNEKLQKAISVLPDYVEREVGDYKDHGFTGRAKVDNKFSFAAKCQKVMTKLESYKLTFEAQKNRVAFGGEPTPDTPVSEEVYELAVQLLDEQINLLYAQIANISSEKAEGEKTEVAEKRFDTLNERLAPLKYLDRGDPIYRTGSKTFETLETDYPQLDENPPSDPKAATILANLQKKKETKDDLKADITALWQHKLAFMRKKYAKDGISYKEVQSYRKARKYAEHALDMCQREPGEGSVSGVEEVKSQIDTTVKTLKEEQIMMLDSLKLLGKKRDIAKEIIDCCLDAEDLLATMSVELLGLNADRIYDLINHVTEHSDEFLTYIPSVFDDEFPGGPYQLTAYQLGPKGELSRVLGLRDHFGIQQLSHDPDIALKDHHSIIYLSKMVKVADLINKLDRDNAGSPNETKHPERIPKLLEKLKTPEGMMGMKKIIGYIHHNPEETKWMLKQWIDGNFLGEPESFIQDIPNSYFGGTDRAKDRKNRMKQYILGISAIKEGVRFDENRGVYTLQPGQNTKHIFEHLFAPNEQASLKHLVYWKPGTSRLQWEDASKLDPTELGEGWKFKKKDGYVPEEVKKKPDKPRTPEKDYSDVIYTLKRGQSTAQINAALGLSPTNVNLDGVEYRPKRQDGTYNDADWTTKKPGSRFLPIDSQYRRAREGTQSASEVIETQLGSLSDNRKYESQIRKLFSKGEVENKNEFQYEDTLHGTHLTFDDMQNNDMPNMVEIVDEFSKRKTRAHFFINILGCNGPMPRSVDEAVAKIKRNRGDFVRKLVPLLEKKFPGTDTYVVELYNHTAFHEYLFPRQGSHVDTYNELQISLRGIRELESIIDEVYKKAGRGNYPRKKYIRYPGGEVPQGTVEGPNGVTVDLKSEYAKLFDELGLRAIYWTHLTNDTNSNRDFGVLKRSVDPTHNGNNVLSHLNRWDEDKKQYLDFIDASLKNPEKTETLSSSVFYEGMKDAGLLEIWKGTDEQILANTNNLYKVFRHFEGERDKIIDVHTSDKVYRRLLRLVRPKLAQFSTILSTDSDGNTQRERNLKTLAVLVGHLRDKVGRDTTGRPIKFVTNEQATRIKNEMEAKNIRIVSTYATAKGTGSSAKSRLEDAHDLIEQGKYPFDLEDAHTEAPYRTSILGFHPKAYEKMNIVFNGFREHLKKKAKSEGKEYKEKTLYINGIAEDIGHALGVRTGGDEIRIAGHAAPAHINGAKIDMPVFRDANGTINEDFGGNGELFTYLTGIEKLKGFRKITTTKNGVKMTIRYGDDGIHGTHMDIHFHI